MKPETKAAAVERKLIEKIVGMPDSAVADEAMAKLRLKVLDLEHRRDEAQEGARIAGNAWRRTKDEADRLRAWLNKFGDAERAEESDMESARTLLNAIHNAKIDISWGEHEPTPRACKAWEETRDACLKMASLIDLFITPGALLDAADIDSGDFNVRLADQEKNR